MLAWEVYRVVYYSSLSHVPVVPLFLAVLSGVQLCSFSCCRARKQGFSHIHVFFRGYCSLMLSDLNDFLPSLTFSLFLLL